MSERPSTEREQPELPGALSSHRRLHAATERERLRIARGERPAFHVRSASSVFGGFDVTIKELPLIHLFVPDESGILDGARALIARTLSSDANGFDLVPDRG